MISNQILQNTIDGLKEITDIELHVLDPEGNELAGTVQAPYDTPQEAKDFAASGQEMMTTGNRHYFKILDDGQPEFVVVTKGGQKEAQVVGRMTAFQLRSLLTAYKEHFDRDNFIKNLLLDNLLLVDIFNRAKKLHIRADLRRAVLIITYRGGRNLGVQEMVRSIPAVTADDFVTEVDADNVVVVRHVQETPDDGEQPGADAEIIRIATQIAAHLEQEGVSGVRIACGTTVAELREVSRSYKEAKMALDVGRIFSEGSRVVSYTELGIGRLIYQLPIPLCRMFIKEIFDNKRPDMFDEETLQTIEKFFENNLNVSETSRQLFIHRNTLVYRLDKLQKMTGLDLRVFEDAITFKIAMMVVKYMSHMEKEEY